MDNISYVLNIIHKELVKNNSSIQYVLGGVNNAVFVKSDHGSMTINIMKSSKIYNNGFEIHCHEERNGRKIVIITVSEDSNLSYEENRDLLNNKKIFEMIDEKIC